jgi:hypothetical protein
MNDFSLVPEGRRKLALLPKSPPTGLLCPLCPSYNCTMHSQDGSSPIMPSDETPTLDPNLIAPVHNFEAKDPLTYAQVHDPQKL